MDGPGYPMIATHDPRLLRIAAAQAALGGRSPDSYEFQMLHGVRPAEQRQLAGTGTRLRVYLPYGQDWYRYLVRRLASARRTWPSSPARWSRPGEGRTGPAGISAGSVGSTP